MAESDKQFHLGLTPEKKLIHRNRCLDCPCQQFQSDDAVTSAVDSDVRMEALIGWFSGAEVTNNGSIISSTDNTKPCPNRLQASIVILNAIRDSCRPHLEPSSPPCISSSPAQSRSKNLQQTVNENVTYEDAFPSLSSTSSTAAPTMLVGRKKSKGTKKNNPSLSSSSFSVAPTMPAGRNNRKGHTKQPLNGGIHATKNNTNMMNNHIGTKKSSTRSQGNLVPKAKKKIKPVTISLSASSSSGRDIPRNISSLPSRDTSEMLSSTTVQIAPKNKFENKPIMMKSSGMVNGCSTEVKTSSTATTPKIHNDSIGGTCSNTISSKIEGNIYSLLSQDTPDILGSATVPIRPKYKVENKSSSIKSSGPENTTNINPSNVHKLNRLVMVYSTILRTHLAPFLLLELHLLVRLVSLSDKSDTFKTADVNTIRPFSDIFQCEKSCRDFAAETLSSLEPVIINMGHETIKMFAALPALQKHCPGICMTLQDVIVAGNSALIFETDQKALGSNTNTPHLTLPFDHARDSRHNYRSVDLNRLFKEREVLRDSFLYQLRAFQDVRGKLMEHAQAEKHLGSIRCQLREMLKNLSSGNNTLWFVNFFCDLLLQIGLVPVSETDSEVLKQIGDKKRLQKLHMRFTSKSGQTNKSSRKLRIDQKGTSSNSNTALPEQCFPGHQEFFSIFLRAGDSYQFNVHLKRRLARIITEMSAVNETKGLCEHLAKTQMLAKFLGMLVFSPNWDLSSSNATSENIEIDIPPINIKECIERAWKRSRLVIVIPWVVQFLGMMKWCVHINILGLLVLKLMIIVLICVKNEYFGRDEVSRKCHYYIDIFSLLWSINHHCLPCGMEDHNYYRTNMMMISLQLDSLFYDVVGLAPAQTLPIMARSTQKTSGSVDSTNFVPFDDLPLWFSKPFLFPPTPYLKDLCELLKDLAQNHGKTPVTASTKKVRPNTVRKLGPIDSSQKCVSRIPFCADNMSPWASKRPGTPNNKGGIKELLVDSFFHQHKDIQQLCEMIVDRAIKNFSHSVLQSCIQPIFRNGATSFEDYFNKSSIMTQEEYIERLKALEIVANREARTLMNDDFNRIIKGTLQLLAPRETKSKVLEVACSLAINHASLRGRDTIRLIISEEKKRLMDEFVRKEKKTQAGVPLHSMKKDNGPTMKKDNAPGRGRTKSHGTKIQSIIDLTASLRAIHVLDDSIGNRCESLKQDKAKVLDHLQKYFIGTESSESVAEFESQIISMLKDFFSNPSSKSILSLQATIEVADVYSLLSSLGYASSKKEDLESLICDTNNILALIDQGKHSTKTDYPAKPIGNEAIGTFLFTLVEGSLVSYRALERALLHSANVNDEAKAVSSVVLYRLASSRAGMVDTTDGLVVMVRLQRLLTRDQPKQFHESE